MKTTLFVLVLFLIACGVMAQQSAVNTGKTWKSSYQQLKRKHSKIQQVDRIILQVIAEMTSRQGGLRTAIAQKLSARNTANNRRNAQLNLVNKLRSQRAVIEGQYNAKRKQELSAANELKVREKLHRQAISAYKSTYFTNTREIANLDREKNILNEIRRLIGANRVAGYSKHRDHYTISKAGAHSFANYQDNRSTFHHGIQQFTTKGKWRKISTVSTGTKTSLAVNLVGIPSHAKLIALVDRGTIVDWHRFRSKTWTSHGFDTTKMLFKVKQKSTGKILYVSFAKLIHMCGMNKLVKAGQYKVMPQLLTSKAGLKSMCYRGNMKQKTCYRVIYVNTSEYLPLQILDSESMPTGCYKRDNAIKYKFDLYAHSI